MITKNEIRDGLNEAEANGKNLYISLFLSMLEEHELECGRIIAKVNRIHDVRTCNGYLQVKILDKFSNTVWHSVRDGEAFFAN